MSGALPAEVRRVTDFGAVGRLWRDLEARAADVPLFRTWTWVGCLAEERFDDPWLVLVAEDGRPCAAALFNRRRGTLCLGESGDDERDSPFVEHNGPILAADAPPAALRALFAAAWRVPGVRRLRLGGVAPDLPERAGGVSGVTVLRPLFWIDLERTRQAGDPLAHLSANSRSQMRRALRAFGGEAARLEPAPGPKALDAFIAAHQAWWQARGKPGAFARPFMRRFHADLLARGEASGEVALRVLRAPDGRAAAWLHLLRRGGHVAAYQSAVACDA
ncbi:MAG: GNAT family N-acetyltransferase, partial [Elioraea sp.]|nr:GNAT family N-acetyltransferase [Elioraea sp.]